VPHVLVSEVCLFSFHKDLFGGLVSCTVLGYHTILAVNREGSNPPQLPYTLSTPQRLLKCKITYQDHETQRQWQSRLATGWL
jgi:hypothetical protein